MFFQGAAIPVLGSAPADVLLFVSMVALLMLLHFLRVVCLEGRISAVWQVALDERKIVCLLVSSQLIRILEVSLAVAS